MASQVIAGLLKGIVLFLDIICWLIVIGALLSWFIDPTHPIRTFITRITEPFVAPFRPLSDKINSSGLPIDFSPLFTYLFLTIIIQLLQRLIIVV
ncbi:MAG: YggT family protein [Xylanivirga thermophila]|uniref:YggT family protein n=1 Tax=Xylanivirga thermophila TaxID=2496273 RepID=UPI0013EAC348|nr:YggT family protein [Xylanivirga thermophila]